MQSMYLKKARDRFICNEYEENLGDVLDKESIDILFHLLDSYKDNVYRWARITAAIRRRCK